VLEAASDRKTAIGYRIAEHERSSIYGVTVNPKRGKEELPQTRSSFWQKIS
jgi:hypothetical protein